MKNSSATFCCQLCVDAPNFTRKSSLKRHIASKHSSSTEFFECAECGSHYRRKDQLQKHIRNMHISDSSTFECAYCSKQFRHKHNLVTHITALHWLEFAHETPYTFECFHCAITFKRKSDIRSHIHRCHSLDVTKLKKLKKSHLRCLKCPMVFLHSKVLKKHYVEVHDILMMEEQLVFDCVANYEQWLENQQHQTGTQFVKWYTKKYSSYSSQRLICHRSRNYDCKLKAEDRKRCLKMSGYKRIGGICPAEIYVKMQNDGTCFVQYQKTHVGHNIEDKSELGLKRISKTEKERIASKVAAGIPLSEIVNQERLSEFSENNISRSTIVNHKDVRNIAASYRISLEPRERVEPRCEPVDLEAVIEQHANDIIFYKRRSEEDLRFKVLDQDDFVIVIMTANQEMYLRTHGSRVICLDGTFGSKPHGFLLHTLLVFDMDYEGLPAAFLLTNRNDECVVNIFLRCIRDRVGFVKSQTLITDTQTTYYNCWLNIMGPPDNFIYHTWHVREAWRKNYSKIPNKTKREAVQKELQSLSCELDPIKFENGLNSFLSREDDDLKKFQNYFLQNYGNSKQMPRWAYCYRKRAGININMNLESFHKSFKHNVTGGSKMKSLTECLILIFRYLVLLQTNILEKEVRGKVTHKLSVLRNRHRMAFKQYEEDASSRVVVIDDNMFLVQSFGEKSIFYTVMKSKSKECVTENNNACCNLVCDLCNLCFHAFNCTCEDSSVKSNMCKHIHLVGLYLRDQQLKSESTMSQCINNETYMVGVMETDDSILGVDIEEYVLANVQCSTENDDNQVFVSVVDNDVLKQKYQQLIEDEMQVLQSLIIRRTGEEMKYIYEKHLKPIYSTLSALEVKAEVPT